MLQASKGTCLAIFCIQFMQQQAQLALQPTMVNPGQLLANAAALNGMLMGAAIGGSPSGAASASPSSARSSPSNGGRTPKASPSVPATPKSKRYRCDKCDAKFTDNTQLKRHASFHGRSLAHDCPLCDYSVPFPINLVKHLRSHHGMQITHMTEVDQLATKMKAEKAAQLLQQEQETENLPVEVTSTDNAAANEAITVTKPDLTATENLPVEVNAPPPQTSIIADDIKV